MYSYTSSRTVTVRINRRTCQAAGGQAEIAYIYTGHRFTECDGEIHAGGVGRGGAGACAGDDAWRAGLHGDAGGRAIHGRNVACGVFGPRVERIRPVARNGVGRWGQSRPAQRAGGWWCGRFGDDVI